MKHGMHVRISREWHNPEIKIVVTDDAIAITIPLKDFIKALVSEVGNPATLVTQAQLERRLSAAATAVTASMKRETVPIA